MALSLWELTVKWVLQGLCLACFVGLTVVPCSCLWHYHYVYLYPLGPLWPLSQSGLLWALTTGNTSLSLALFSNWPQAFTVSLKNAAHRSAAKEQIMRWNQRGIQWPFFCVNSSSCSSQHCSFLLLSCLPECVTSHGSIFSCAVVCFLCWGGAIVKRASEKILYSTQYMASSFL